MKFFAAPILLSPNFEDLEININHYPKFFFQFSVFAKFALLCIFIPILKGITSQFSFLVRFISIISSFFGRNP
jgi:hypothetical protein